MRAAAARTAGSLWPSRRSAEAMHAFNRGRITSENRIDSERAVPSLFRLLLTVALLAGLAYGAMLALVTFVTPEPHEIIQNVPAARLNK